MEYIEESKGLDDLHLVVIMWYFITTLSLKAALIGMLDFLAREQFSKTSSSGSMSVLMRLLLQAPCPY